MFEHDLFGKPLDTFPDHALAAQPVPQRRDQAVGVGLVVVFILYAIWLVRRDPGLGDRVGSIVADE